MLCRILYAKTFSKLKELPDDKTPEELETHIKTKILKDNNIKIIKIDKLLPHGEKENITGE